MRFKIVAIVAGSLLASGCADLATGLAIYADQLEMEQGTYWEDEHTSESFGGDCPAFAEFGRVNNQTYLRVRNLAQTASSITVDWSSGFQSSFYLQPGETSAFVYMTPSLWPSAISRDC
ncbi:hypothetical protein GVN24_28465 [Rhizobium sp. CRIBSB]|nr:hypothetical protein [Rhizobium sp. CRIBSB]